MRMRFDVDDEDEASAVREVLVEQFAVWLDDHPHAGPADPWDADLALSWKWGYGDGCYDRWTRADVDELLLEHLPRKLSANPEEAASIPVSLGAFARFLDDQGLLDRAGDTAEEVAGRALAQQRAFLDAMADPAKYGMAKRLMSSGAFDVGDEPDQAALDEAMTAFNALPFEERGRILGIHDEALDDRFDDDLLLPPLPLRPGLAPGAMEAAAADAVLLTQVDGLHAALGAGGATLTKAGRLRLADARRLVAEIGLGDRTEGVRSSAEMPELFSLVQVAIFAGAVDLDEDANRLRPVADWPSTPADVRWAAVVTAVLTAGPARLSFGARQPVPHDLTDLADEGVTDMLALLWLADEPMPPDTFATILHELSTLDPPTALLSALSPDLARDQAAARIDDVVEWLAAAGVVAAEPDGLVLTAAGPRLVAPTLAAAGFDVLLPEDVAALDAGAALDLVIERDEVAADVATLWAAGRPEREAADALVAELRSRPEPVRVVLGFSMLEQLGAVAVDAVRALLDTSLAPHAWMFLAGQGAVAPGDVPDEAAVRAGVDTFLAMTELGSPADALEPLLGHLDVSQQRALFEDLAGGDHPQTGEMLELLGRHHPDKALGKHARKLAHRWRSAHGRR
jgi:hypothetical protein